MLPKASHTLYSPTTTEVKTYEGLPKPDLSKKKPSPFAVYGVWAQRGSAHFNHSMKSTEYYLWTSQ